MTLTLIDPTVNVFCPTGKGGGIDPTCGGGGKGRVSVGVSHDSKQGQDTLKEWNKEMLNKFGKDELGYSKWGDARDEWNRGRYGMIRQVQLGKKVVDPNGKDVTSELKAKSDILEEAISSSPKFAATDLHRGLHSLDEDTFNFYTKKGNEFEVKTMQSFSTSEKTARKFGDPNDSSKSNRKVLFKVNTDAGAFIGGSFGESEAIVPKGTKFRIKKVRKMLSNKYGATVELEEVSNG